MSGPTLTEFLAGQFLDSTGRVGHHDGAGSDAMEHDKVSQTLVGFCVRDGGQGHPGQGLIRSVNRLGRKSKVLSGLDQT